MRFPDHDQLDTQLGLIDNATYTSSRVSEMVTQQVHISSGTAPPSLHAPQRICGRTHCASSWRGTYNQTRGKVWAGTIFIVQFQDWKCTKAVSPGTSCVGCSRSDPNLCVLFGVKPISTRDLQRFTQDTISCNAALNGCSRSHQWQDHTLGAALTHGWPCWIGLKAPINGSIKG